MTPLKIRSHVLPQVRWDACLVHSHVVLGLNFISIRTMFGIKCPFECLFMTMGWDYGLKWHKTKHLAFWVASSTQLISSASAMCLCSGRNDCKTPCVTVILSEVQREGVKTHTAGHFDLCLSRHFCIILVWDKTDIFLPQLPFLLCVVFEQMSQRNLRNWQQG